MPRITARRVLTGSVLVLVAGLVPGLTTSAHADDSSTLTVVGTSDVFDSNLVQTVIKPGFEAAYPGITLNYVSKGTGAAIAFAEAGTASALLVHAASVENQFVDQGYSLEKYGRAIFWGDYVLLGPASDPAGVMTGSSSENIVQAFEKIATAGAAGHANFSSRSGSPGTTVQEHAIWALASGVTGCHVTDANGGGFTPATSADDGTGHCPSSTTYPDWYHSANLTQAPNIEAADACNYTTGGPGNNNCYVFTDRGTFNYLVSTHAISNMQLVVDNNDQAPTDQKNLLVNSFHLYGINPDAVPSGSQINTVGATDLLNWMTTKAAQDAVGAYLESNGNAPFRPDASPLITATSLPTKVTGGDTVTVKGHVKNVVPGTPALNGVRVTLLRKSGATTSVAKRATTDANGKYVIRFKPSQTGTYTLSTPGLEKVERPDLDPIFADLLAPSSLPLSRIVVKANATIRSATPVGSRKVELKGKVAPTATGRGARLQIWAAHPGKKLHQVTQVKLADGAGRFDRTVALGTGTWRVKVRYVNPGVVRSGTSGVARVSLG